MISKLENSAAYNGILFRSLRIAKRKKGIGDTKSDETAILISSSKTTIASS